MRCPIANTCYCWWSLTILLPICGAECAGLQCKKKSTNLKALFSNIIFIFRFCRIYFQTMFKHPKLGDPFRYIYRRVYIQNKHILYRLGCGDINCACKVPNGLLLFVAFTSQHCRVAAVVLLV